MREHVAVGELFAQRGIEVAHLRGSDATRKNVTDVLKSEERATVLHFTGHGSVDATDPRASGLVLHDEVLTTGWIRKMIKQPPVLVVVNACETSSRTLAASDIGQKETAGVHLTRLFGIARPFLELGSYVLATRWKVSDEAAGQFAPRFYTALLDGKPTGEALVEARRAMYDARPDDLSWASYIYYGDPRLIIKIDEAALGGEPTPAVNVPAEPRVVAVEGEEAPRLAADSDTIDYAAFDATDLEDRAEREDRRQLDDQHPFDAKIVDTFVAPQVRVPLELASIPGRYREIRQTVESGSRRTMMLERLLDPARARASTIDSSLILTWLRSDDEGERMLGVAVAEAAPQAAFIERLIDLVREPFSNFEQFHSLVALRDALKIGAPESAVELSRTLTGLLREPEFRKTDRAFVAREILAASPSS
jgi:hypothetical protein